VPISVPSTLQLELWHVDFYANYARNCTQLNHFATAILYQYGGAVGLAQSKAKRASQAGKKSKKRKYTERKCFAAGATSEQGSQEHSVCVLIVFHIHVAFLCRKRVGFPVCIGNTPPTHSINSSVNPDEYVRGNWFALRLYYGFEWGKYFSKKCHNYRK